MEFRVQDSNFYIKRLHEYVFVRYVSSDFDIFRFDFLVH